MNRAISLALFSSILFAQTPEPERGKITLLVIDSDTRTPIKGARVSLGAVTKVGDSYKVSMNAVTPVASNERGEVEFANLRPMGYMVLNVIANGYSFRELSSIEDILYIKPGEHLNGPPISVFADGEITGIVADQEGRAVQGAQVEALGEYGGVFSRKVMVRDFGTTNERGAYRIGKLPPGRYFVRVSNNSPAPLIRTYFPNGRDMTEAVQVNVAAGRDLDRIDFRVRRAPVLHIRGILDGAAGKKLSLNLFSCMPGDEREASQQLEPIQVGADGSFDVEQMAGTYCLEYRSRSPGENPLGSYVRVKIPLERDIEGLRLTPLPQRELSGVIKIEGGSELAMPTSIEISPVDVVAPTLSATVGTDGKFRFPSAMPIDYELQLSPSAGYVKSLHFAGGEATDRRLHLGSTFGPFTIEIAQGRGRVRGKVSLGSAKPVRTAVTLQPTGPLSDRSDLLLVTFADENGEFQFPAVVPGIYRVLAFADADPLAIRTPEFLSLFQVSSVSVLEGQESGIDVPLISPGEFEDAKARF